jgi:hypothetical protein
MGLIELTGSALGDIVLGTFLCLSLFVWLEWRSGD